MDREHEDAMLLANLETPEDPVYHGSWGFYVFNTCEHNEQSKDHANIPLDRIRDYMCAYVQYERSQEHRDQLKAALRLSPIHLPGATLSQVRHYVMDNLWGEEKYGPRYAVVLVIDEGSRASLTSGPEPQPEDRSYGIVDYRDSTEAEKETFVYALDIRFDEAKGPVSLHMRHRGPGGGSAPYPGWMKVTPRSLYKLWDLINGGFDWDVDFDGPDKIWDGPKY